MLYSSFLFQTHTDFMKSDLWQVLSQFQCNFICRILWFPQDQCFFEGFSFSSIYLCGTNNM